MMVVVLPTAQNYLKNRFFMCNFLTHLKVLDINLNPYLYFLKDKKISNLGTLIQPRMLKSIMVNFIRHKTLLNFYLIPLDYWNDQGAWLVLYIC